MTIRIVAIMLAVACFVSNTCYGHGGGLNADGCHNQKSDNTYHCHQSSNIKQPITEAYFNDFLASQLGGQAEVVIKYDFEGPSGEKLYGSIRVDIVTEDKVVEGGLDKRRSLDSLQQAVFASTLTNKHPAVAIYDTDGAWGNIEYRVLTAAKHLGVAFYWVKLNEIQRLN